MKPQRNRPAPTRTTPDKLARVGQSGVALSEGELGQATGGATLAEGRTVKIDFCKTGY